jgi:phosphate transport system substrate-binding protein
MGPGLIKCSAILLCFVVLALPRALYASDEKVIIGGAQSLTPLAEQFSAHFRKRHPDLGIEIRRSNSNYAVQAAERGEIHIGLVSRSLTPDEKSNLYAKSIGHDALVILSHPGNAVSHLSLDQLRDIYRGKIIHWREVGGGESGIVPLTREPGSALRSIFVERLFGKSSHDEQNAFVLRANKEKVLRTIKRVRGSLGYGIVRIDEAQAEGVTVVAVNKLLPTAANLQNERYPFTRPYLVVVKAPPEGVVLQWISGFAEFMQQATAPPNS